MFVATEPLLLEQGRGPAAADLGWVLLLKQVVVDCGSGASNEPSNVQAIMLQQCGTRILVYKFHLASSRLH